MATHLLANSDREPCSHGWIHTDRVSSALIPSNFPDPATRRVTTLDLSLTSPETLSLLEAFSSKRIKHIKKHWTRSMPLFNFAGNSRTRTLRSETARPFLRTTVSRWMLMLQGLYLIKGVIGRFMRQTAFLPQKDFSLTSFEIIAGVPCRS